MSIKDDAEFALKNIPPEIASGEYKGIAADCSPDCLRAIEFLKKLVVDPTTTDYTDDGEITDLDVLWHVIDMFTEANPDHPRVDEYGECSGTLSSMQGELGWQDHND